MAFSQENTPAPAIPPAPGQSAPDIELPTLPLPPLPSKEEKIENDAPVLPAPPASNAETGSLPPPPAVEVVPSEKSQPFGISGEEKPAPSPAPVAPPAPKEPTAPATPAKEEALSSCTELFTRVAQCVPSTCQQDTPKGKVSFRLSGMKEEFCQFSFTLPGQTEPATCHLSAKGQEGIALGIKSLLETGQQSIDPAYTEILERECQLPTPPSLPTAPADKKPEAPATSTPEDVSLDLPQLESKKSLPTTASKCDDFPENLEGCQPYKCQELAYDEQKQDFIKTRTIFGQQEGLCRYQETLPDNFMLNCNLSKKNGANFATYFRLLKTPEKAAQQPDTITLYYDTMENACKVTGDDGQELALDLYFSLSNLPGKITEFGAKDVPQGDCSTLNEKLKTCEPFYCKGNDPVQEKFFNRQVEIERKIIGLHEGTCYYLEQKPEAKPQGCRYTAAQSSTTSQCSIAILLDMTKIEGMFAKTAAEQAADVEKKEADKKKENKEPDAALTMWKPKLKEMPKLNYKTQYLSSIIYKKQYSNQNKGLPKAYYLQDYRAMAFDALNKGDVNALQALIAKIDEIYKQQAEKTDTDTPKEKKLPRHAIEIRDYNGNTLLIRSIMAGRYTLTRMLVGEGANLDAQNKSGSTALHVAAYGGRLDMVNFLLSMGADANLKDHYGRTALSLAIDQKYGDIAKVLLAKGGNPNVGMGETASPLMAVIQQNNASAVRYLLRSGVDVNAADATGQTPLMLAAKLGNAAVVDILLNNGANALAQDRMGKTAEKYAIAAGQGGIARHLASVAIDSNLKAPAKP